MSNSRLRVIKLDSVDQGAGLILVMSFCVRLRHRRMRLSSRKRSSGDEGLATAKCAFSSDEEGSSRTGI